MMGFTLVVIHIPSAMSTTVHPPEPVNPTIAEIARQAGVGTATVDRVINGRAGVNADTALKVMNIIQASGGNKAIARGRPRRSGKAENLRFAFVLPTGQAPFLALMERQIAQSASEFRHQQITEVTHCLDPADPAEFAANLALLHGYDGIALLGPDLPPLKQAINALVRSGVQVVTLFSDIAGSKRAVYVGCDNRAAGRTAGLLLGRMAGGGGTADTGRNTLLLASQATRLSGEIERRIGFAQVIEERFAHLRVLRTPDLPESNAEAHSVLAAWLGSGGCDTQAVAGLYNVGSGTAGVVAAVQTLKASNNNIPIVAHDLCDAHRRLLESGVLAYVLAQDIHYCVQSAAKVMQALCANVRGAIDAVQPRIEIFTAENLY